MIRVGVGIMAHPRRRAFVDELLTKLDRPAEVVWDRGNNDRWDTGRRTMLSCRNDPTATHWLALQDDAVIPRDLVAGVERALAHVPDGSPLSLYCGRVKPFRETVASLVAAAGPGTSWLSMAQIHWGVGIVMPTKLIPDMIAWCDPRTDVANYDRRISRWCQYRGLTVYYPWPSLVDHRDSPSLVPGRGSAGRRAHRFLGATRSALDASWDGRVVGIPELGGPAPAVAPPLGPLPKGTKVKFISPQYPALQAHTVTSGGRVIRVRFVDGRAETTNPAAIEHLRGLAHMGVKPVGAAVSPPAEPAASAPAPVGPEPPALPEQGQEPVASAEAGRLMPPSPPEPAAAGDQVPDGGAKEVMVWVDDDPQRARLALDAEQAREKPRSTLVATLTKLAG